MENIKPEDINVLNKIDSTCTSNIVETRVQGTLSKIDDPPSLNTPIAAYKMWIIVFFLTCYMSTTIIR